MTFKYLKQIKDISALETPGFMTGWGSGTASMAQTKIQHIYMTGAKSCPLATARNITYV